MVCSLGLLLDAFGQGLQELAEVQAGGEQGVAQGGVGAGEVDVEDVVQAVHQHGGFVAGCFGG